MRILLFVCVIQTVFSMLGASSTSADDVYADHTCKVSQIKQRAEILRDNFFEHALKLNLRTRRHVKKHIKATGHSYEDNLAKNQLIPVPDYPLNASDVVMEHGRKYLLFACPRDVEEANLLFEAAMQQKVFLFVSLLESTEAEDKLNNYWRQENLAKIITPSGWSFAVKSVKTLETAPREAGGLNEPKILETSITATHTSGEVRELTHLHYEGWRDREAMPSEPLFHTLLDRIIELQGVREEVPIAINCHGGVGRTGTTAVSHYLRKEIDRQLAHGISIHDITVNIPNILFAFRLQRNDLLAQATQLANVYSVLGDYVHRKIAEAADIPAAHKSYYSFSKEATSLSKLKKQIEKLKEQEMHGFEKITDKIEIRFFQFLESQKKRGKPHDFNTNLSILRMGRQRQSCNLNASDLHIENDGKYLIYACPRTMEQIGVLYDLALQQNSTLFVTALKQTEASDRINNFWKIKTLSTHDGWTVTYLTTTLLGKERGVSLYETTLLAQKGMYSKTITHLHYDGWHQDHSMPSQKLFLRMLNRMKEVYTETTGPIVVQSKHGVGRSGTVAASHFLCRQIDAQLKAGADLDKIVVNIPKTIFEFRKQRNGFVEHPPLVMDVYEAVLAYYEQLKGK